MAIQFPCRRGTGTCDVRRRGRDERRDGEPEDANAVVIAIDTGRVSITLLEDNGEPYDLMVDRSIGAVGNLRLGDTVRYFQPRCCRCRARTSRRRALGREILQDPAKLHIINGIRSFLENNQRDLVDYQQARMEGRRVSSASAESVMNHLVNRRLSKRQQMRWSMKGAHYLLQTRVELLDGRLERCFLKRFPHFRSSESVRR